MGAEKENAKEPKQCDQSLGGVRAWHTPEGRGCCSSCSTCQGWERFREMKLAGCVQPSVMWALCAKMFAFCGQWRILEGFRQECEVTRLDPSFREMTSGHDVLNS